MIWLSLLLVAFFVYVIVAVIVTEFLIVLVGLCVLVVLGVAVSLYIEYRKADPEAAAAERRAAYVARWGEGRPPDTLEYVVEPKLDGWRDEDVEKDTIEQEGQDGR
jgi:hypothetical protein